MKRTNHKTSKILNPYPGIIFASLFILTILSFVILCGFNSPSEAAPAYSGDIMPSSQVRAGMRGYGLSVFKGTQIESFPVVVVGKLKNRIGDSDMILVKVTGGYPYYSKAGIIAGMSGSPVYINGKLIGAIGYGWDFSREPIGGVTPIENMLKDITGKNKYSKFSTKNDSRNYTLEEPLYINGKKYDQAIVKDTYLPYQGKKPAKTMIFSPVPSVLQAQGFSEDSIKILKEKLEPYGVVPVAVPGGSRISKNRGYTVRPGSALGVTLIDGDLNLGATGTVTYVSNDRFLAFGHPMMKMGSTRVPVNAAYIEGIMNSPLSSFKFSSSMGIIGTMEQDRLFAISGTLGRKPPMIPVSIEVTDTERRKTRIFKVQVLNHPILSPLFLTIANSQAVSSSTSMMKKTSAKIHYEIDIKDNEKLEFDDYVSGPNVRANITEQIFAYLKPLYISQYEPAKIKRMKISIQVFPYAGKASIEDISAQLPQVRPGENINLNIRLRTSDGKIVTKDIAIQAPPDLPKGQAKIAVTGAEDIDYAKGKLRVGEEDPTSTKQIIDRIRKAKRNNEIVVVAAFNRKTASFAGERLNNLPVSKQSIFFSSPRAIVKMVPDVYISSVKMPCVVEGTQFMVLSISSKAQMDTSSSGVSDNDDSDSSDDGEKTSKSAKMKNISIFDISEDITARIRERLGENVTLVPMATVDKTTQTKKTDTSKKVLPSGSITETLSSPQDYYTGIFDNTSINNGNVTLGHEVEFLYDSPLAYVMTMHYDPASDRTIAAEAPGGNIIEIKNGAKPRILGKTGEILAPCMAADSSGNIFIGTGPNGRIYKLTPDGKLSRFCTLPDEIIWALLPQASGEILAGTGNSGKVYRLNPDGKYKIIYNSPDTHITSLCSGPEGSIFIGSANQGTIYKMLSDGKIVTYYRALEGSIDAMIWDESTGDLWIASETLLYKVDKQMQTKIYIFPEEGILNLTRDNNGNILAATSNVGRIYRIDPKTDKFENLFEKNINQVFKIAIANNGDMLIATGNPGKIARVKTNYASTGSFLSRVIDTKKTSLFGAVKWLCFEPKGTQVTLQSRSGNSISPDSGWSDWSPHYTAKEGQKIMNPPGRYLQLKANLSSTDSAKTPLLYTMKLYYQRQNSSPLMALVSPEGGENWSGHSEIKWKSYVANAETLAFSLFYSQDGGTTWKPIKENLPATLAQITLNTDNSEIPKAATEKYTWATNSLKDGQYIIKILGFDLTDPDNSLLSGNIISKAIIICNKKPEITIVSNKSTKRRAVIVGFVKTGISGVKEVNYKINKGKWLLAYPVDGIFDNEREKFVIYLNSPYPKNFEISVKATDEAGNIKTITQKMNLKIDVEESKPKVSEEGQNSGDSDDDEEKD